MTLGTPQRGRPSRALPGSRPTDRSGRGSPDELALMSMMAFEPKPGTKIGARAAVATAATATRLRSPAGGGLEPRSRAHPDPHRPPALHPSQRVGEHHRQRPQQEYHPVLRLDQLLQHGVGEREEREWRQEGQEWAARAERERVAREHRGPNGDDAREEQRLQRNRRARSAHGPVRRSIARHQSCDAAFRASADRARSSWGTRSGQRPRTRARPTSASPPGGCVARGHSPRPLMRARRP